MSLFVPGYCAVQEPRDTVLAIAVDLKRACALPVKIDGASMLAA